MTRRISYIAIVSALALFFCLNLTHAKESSQAKPEGSRITQRVLDNGLTVLVKEDRSLPIVSFEARFKTGSAREGKYLGSGISHFVEHMLFKGTPTREAGQIEKEVKSYGGTINGFTSFDSTGYKLTVESQYFKKALELLKDAVMNPAFIASEIEKERDVILKEIKLNKDNPGKRAFQLLFSNVYREHPYRYPVIGYEDVFKEITREDLISYHKQNYRPDNLVVGICGDVDEEEAQEETKRLFGDYKRKAEELTIVPREPKQISKREYRERTNIQLPRILMGYHSVPIGHEDLFSLDVLASALGEGRSSILPKRLVEDEKLVYAVSAFNYTPKDPGVFVISMLLDEKNIPQATNVLTGEIEKIKSGKIDSEQLTKAKNRALSSYLWGNETIQAQVSDSVEGEVLVGNPDFSRFYVDKLNAVEKEDVVRVANQYLKESNQTTVSLLPKKTEIEKPAKVKQNKDEITIKKFDLPSGMKLLVREDSDLPLVAIRVAMKGGTRVETRENNGISNITADLLLSGTKKRSKEEIFLTIEEGGGAIGSFSGNNSLGISCSLLAGDLDLGLELVADILKNAVFPEDEFGKIKDLTLAAIKNREDDIFESGIKLFKENLFKDHPYRFTTLGVEDSVETLTKDDILDFYKRFCVPGNTVISVFGDVDAEEVFVRTKRLFKHYSGDVPTCLTKPTPRVDAPSVSNKKVMDKEQVLVMGGFKTIRITNPDRYAFSVLSSILSGSDGRFYYDVRDKLGISYTQGVLSVPGLDKGYFLFYIATSKEHANKAKELITEELNSLREGSVRDEEMELAKTDLIASHVRGLQSLSGLGFETTLDELYGLGFDNFKKFTSRVTAVTKEDINRIIDKYFSKENLTVVTLGPL